MDAIFQNPTEEQSFVTPGRYVVKVVKLEAMPPNPEHPDWAPSIRWYFNLATYPGMEVVRDPSSQEPVELWQYTSTSMNTKSKGRPWVEALLGRKLGPEDSGEAIGKQLLGAKAIAMVGPNQAGKDAILSIQPYTDPKAGKGKTADAPRPEMVAELESDLPAAERSAVPAF